MKKQLVVLAGAILIFSTSFAQQNGMKRPQGDRPMMQQQGKPPMMRGLDLTEEQKTQWQSMQQQFAAQRKMIMDDEKISVKEQRDKLFLMQKSHMLAMQQMLTPEQKEKMKTARTNMQQRGMQGPKHQMRPGKPGMQGGQMGGKLALTDTQKTQLRELNSKKTDRMALIMSSPNRQAFESALEKAQATHKAELEKILTPEQMKQWQDMRQQHPRRPGGGQHFQRGGRPGIV